MHYDYLLGKRQKVKKAVIQVGFPEEDHLGCDKHCHFCLFDKVNYNLPCYPDDADMDRLFKVVDDGGFIQICGAGDPLYHLDKNKEKLLHIINYIKQHGYKVQLVTKYHEVVAEHWNNILKDIDMYSFSTEILDEDLLKLINLLIDSGKKIKLSKVYNFDPYVENVNKDFILKYIKFYSNVSNKKQITIALRANFNFPEEATFGLPKEKEWLEQHRPIDSCHVFLHGPHIGALLLGNHDIVRCMDTIEMIEKHMGVKLKDLLEHW